MKAKWYSGTVKAYSFPTFVLGPGKTPKKPHLGHYPDRESNPGPMRTLPQEHRSGYEDNFMVKSVSEDRVQKVELSFKTEE